MESIARVLKSRWTKIGVPALVVAVALAAVVLPMIGGAALITLHPSGVSSAGSWVTSPTAGNWATYLDTADGDTSYAWVSSEDNTAVVDFDDTGVSVGSITSVTVAASVRDFNGVREGYQLGMSDGTNLIWGTVAQAPSAWTTVTYTSATAPDGTSWDWTDINNLKGAVAHKKDPAGGVSASAWTVPTGDGDVVNFGTAPLWSKVDETTSTANDTDLTLLTTNGGGNALFTFAPFALPVDASGISVTVWVRSADISTANGANNLRPALRVSGTTTFTPTGVSDWDPAGNAAYGWTSYTYNQNPGTGAAWTAADVNGTSAAPLEQFGVYSNDANPDLEVTAVYCQVDYTANPWDSGSRLGVSEMMVTIDYQADVTSPTVTGATYVDSTHVDVSFDETLSAASIAPADFTVNGGLSVSAASLQGDKTVRLTTSAQTEGQQYTVTIAGNVDDLAGNHTLIGSTAQWTRPDLTGPTVVSAVPLDGTHVDVSFNETVAAGTLNAAYFTLDNGASVFTTTAVDADTVRLTTSATSDGMVYTVTVAAGVTDLVGNAVGAGNWATYTGPDTTPIRVSSATQVDSTHIDVSFNETVAPASIDAAYFAVDNGISISGAAAQSAKVVRLTCSALSAGTFYTVTVDDGAPSITDETGNDCVAPNNTGAFTGVDVTPPRVVSASAAGSTLVDVVFDENLAGASIDPSYFGIAGLTVSGATLQADNRTVRLNTSMQTPATNYTITVDSGAPTVQDVAGNPCVAPNNTTIFSGYGGEGIWVPAGVNVSVQATDNDIQFTYANVTSANWMYVTPATMSQMPPSMTYKVGSYFDITFDGTFTGNVTVSLPYNASEIMGVEADTKLYKYDGASWTNVTTGIDTLTDKVTGQSTSFSGWAAFSPIVAGDSPHSGYSSATSKCGVCHAVHGAEDAANSQNGEKLLRSTVAASCDYCHVGGPFAATQVYQSSTAKYAQDLGYEHSIGAAYTSISDSNDSTTADLAWDPANDYSLAGGLKCTTCHSVHGKDCIDGVGGAATNVLKVNPNPSNATSVPADVAAAAYDPWFCQDCHSSNWVATHDRPTGGFDTASHVMTSSVASTLAASASDNCRDCHSGASVVASTSAGNNYPHYTAGKYFLKDAFDQTGTVRYDSVCLDCHPSGTVW